MAKGATLCCWQRPLTAQTLHPAPFPGSRERSLRAAASPSPPRSLPVLPTHGNFLRNPSPRSLRPGPLGCGWHGAFPAPSGAKLSTKEELCPAWPHAPAPAAAGRERFRRPGPRHSPNLRPPLQPFIASAASDAGAASIPLILLEHHISTPRVLREPAGAALPSSASSPRPALQHRRHPGSGLRCRGGACSARGPGARPLRPCWGCGAGGGQGGFALFFPRRRAAAAGRLSAAGSSGHCGIHPVHPAHPGPHIPHIPHIPHLPRSARPGLRGDGARRRAQPRGGKEGRQEGRREGMKPRSPRAAPRSPPPAHLRSAGALPGAAGCSAGDAARRPHKEQEMAAASALPRLWLRRPLRAARRRGEPRPRRGKGLERRGRLLPQRRGGCAAGPRLCPRSGPGGSSGLAAARRRRLPAGRGRPAAPPGHGGERAGSDCSSPSGAGWVWVPEKAGAGWDSPSRCCCCWARWVAGVQPLCPSEDH